MVRRLSIAGLLLPCLLLTACVTPQPSFEWGGYEPALYAFAKHPDRRPEYKASLERAVERGRQSNRVAPGLLAELGYVHLQDGDTDGAIVLFQEEMRRFPESSAFLTGVIERARGTDNTKVSANP